VWPLIPLKQTPAVIMMCGAKLAHSTNKQLAATSELFQSEQSYFCCLLVGLVETPSDRQRKLTWWLSLSRNWNLFILITTA